MEKKKQTRPTCGNELGFCATQHTMDGCGVVEVVLDLFKTAKTSPLTGLDCIKARPHHVPYLLGVQHIVIHPCAVQLELDLRCTRVTYLAHANEVVLRQTSSKDCTLASCASKLRLLVE